MRGRVGAREQYEAAEGWIWLEIGERRSLESNFALSDRVPAPRLLESEKVGM